MRWRIYSWFTWCKDYQNRSRFGKVVTFTETFLWTTIWIL